MTAATTAVKSTSAPLHPPTLHSTVVTTNSTTDGSWLDRVREWAGEKDNWKWLVLATVTPVAIGGLTWWYLSSSSSSDKSTGGKQRKRKSKKNKSVTLDSTTAVDKEAADTAKVEEDDYVATSRRNEVVTEELVEAAEEETPETTTPDDVAQLSDQKREELALAAKNRGNKYYAAKKYNKAIELYTKAIQYFDKGNPKSAVFYSNRAACYANLNDMDKVVEDCTAALEADPKYARALSRRANAFEKLDRMVDGLHDYTVACIVEEFKNATTMEAADRVLRAIAKKQAKELFASNRKHELPSLSFISAYLSSYRYEYLSEEELKSALSDEGDKLFVKAVKAYRSKQWENAFKFSQQAVEKESKSFMPQALNMLGTFQFLMGTMEEAETNFQRSLELKPSYVNSYIKMASVLMENDQEMATFQKTLKLFEEAARHDSTDPDIFYHRGQIYFLMQDYKKALQEYEKSIQLDSSFIFAKIQSAVAYYRMSDIAKASTMFQELVKEFPMSADIRYYYGEILLDQRDIESCIREFKEATKLNPSFALPLLNRGIIAFHIQNDFEEAMSLTQKAIEVDNRCELAYLHLAQMYTQQGRLTEAIITYKRAIDLSRTTVDAESAIMGLEAARAQMAAIERLGATPPMQP